MSVFVRKSGVYLVLVHQIEQVAVFVEVLISMPFLFASPNKPVRLRQDSGHLDQVYKSSGCAVKCYRTLLHFMSI